MKAPSPNARRVLYYTVAVLFVLLLGSGVLLMSFYATPPSAIRVNAYAGILSFESPGLTRPNNAISWPMDRAAACTLSPVSGFDPEVPQETWQCREDDPLSGTLWLPPSSRVSLLAGDEGTEIHIETVDNRPFGSASFRLANGLLRNFELPAKFILQTPHHNTIVLPVVGKSVQIGRAIEWQAMTTEPILQSGQVTLLRESFFGDMLFSSENVELLVGDWIRVESRFEDYVQGLVQIDGSREFQVALTTSEGDVLLYRMARDPLRLNAPLAAHIFRDPTLIVLWAFLSLALGGFLTLYPFRPRLSKDPT